MQRLRVYATVLSLPWCARRVRPAGVSAVLTAMLIVAGAVIAATATDSPTVELNPVVAPPNPDKLHPVERLERDDYGLVGSFPLDEKDLSSLLYPSVTEDEKAAVLEGLKFFTTPHTESDSLGPFANHRFCQGCHLNSADFVRNNGDEDRGRDRNGLVTTPSVASRAARSSPTNFSFTSFDPSTVRCVAPDNDDAISNTGETAAFTLFRDFAPGMGNFVSFFSTAGVQRVRPSLDACLPDRIPLNSEDSRLAGGVDSVTFLSSS